jgi:hypothetical protein
LRLGKRLVETIKFVPTLLYTMPAQSALSEEEKTKVKGAIPKTSCKIFFATIARIYYAHPQPNRWSYSGLQGALAFLKDTTRNAFFFQLVDLEGTRGVVWEHEVYEGFEYFQDRPFFHSFAGDVSFHGFHPLVKILFTLLGISTV